MPVTVQPFWAGVSGRASRHAAISCCCGDAYDELVPGNVEEVTLEQLAGRLWGTWLDLTADELNITEDDVREALRAAAGTLAPSTPQALAGRLALEA